MTDVPEVVDRVAKAIYEKSITGMVAMVEWEGFPIEYRDMFYAQARAAIEAMREPTEAMQQIARFATSPYPIRQEVRWAMRQFPHAYCQDCGYPLGIGGHACPAAHRPDPWAAMIDAALGKS